MLGEVKKHLREAVEREKQETQENVSSNSRQHSEICGVLDSHVILHIHVCTCMYVYICTFIYS